MCNFHDNLVSKLTWFDEKFGKAIEILKNLVKKMRKT